MWCMTVRTFFCISIHAAQEGCDVESVKVQTATDISIHAAQEGCDNITGKIQFYGNNFNPRSPSGLRQNRRKREARARDISIHAARVGCDTF